MNIIVDAMGGDNAPQAPVSGAVRAVCELGVKITLVGKPQAIREELAKHNYPEDMIEIVEADDVISNYDEPVKAVREKTDASVVVAAHLLREGKGDALLSMGSTGALLAAGLLIVGRIKGIRRPAIASPMPSVKGASLLIDAGANVDCKVEDLVQFGLMGSIYMEKVQGKKKPRVGLISNGEEEGKGCALVKSAYIPMASAGYNFIGNVEGRDVLLGTADVFVADGFVGNIVLKTAEGVGMVVKDALKNMISGSIRGKIGALFLKKDLMEFKKLLDYKEYGGAPLLGVKGIVIKGHGSSDEKAVFSALRQTKLCVEQDICGVITGALEAGSGEGIGKVIRNKLFKRK